jgi:tripartite-type tricarboxylate transporter receptor subunit TctC
VRSNIANSPPFSAAGPPDLLGRLIGQKLLERFGRAITIDNRPGAGTKLATRAAAAADSDSYALLQVNATFAYAPGCLTRLTALSCMMI